MSSLLPSYRYTVGYFLGASVTRVRELPSPYFGTPQSTRLPGQLSSALE